MFKTILKLLGILFCGVAVSIPIFIMHTPMTRAMEVTVRDSTPTAAATATPTATPPPNNATVTLDPGGTNPIGRPGTPVQITGSGFQPNSVVDLYTTPDTNQCSATNTENLQPFKQPRTSVKEDGSFNITSSWPDNANQPTTAYYICAIGSGGNPVAVSDKPFTIAQDVTINVSTNNVNAGDKVTITGANWPASQPVVVSIATAADANSIISQQINTDGNGNFSVDLTIPKETQPGTYGINAVAVNNSTTKIFKADAITINAAPTPTPTPSPSPTATATPQPTPTPTTGGGNGPSLMTILILTLGGLGIVLVIIGLTMYLSYSNSAS